MNTLLRPLLFVGAAVLSRVTRPVRQLAEPADDEIAHYATMTFREGELVASTPEVTYGELRARDTN